MKQYIRSERLSQLVKGDWPKLGYQPPDGSCATCKYADRNFYCKKLGQKVYFDIVNRKHSDDCPLFSNQ